MRRRDFITGLSLAAATHSAHAQERAKQHRIAIVVASGPVTRINESRAWQAFWEQLRRLGDVEGENLIVERYSGEGRSEGYGELARQVVSHNPDVIVPISPSIMQAVSAATTTIPIVGSGAYTELGQVPSLARPGGNITGITVDVGWQSGIDGKRLQILKEALPSVSKVGVLTMRTAWDDAGGERFREAGRQLAISVTGMLLEESTPSEYRRVFAENAQRRPDAIVIIGTGELFPFRQLIAEIAENNRLPAIYPLRDYAEAGGLMSYGSDLVELWRRMANDLHEVLNGVKPGDIPIYQPTKFELVINLKAATALNLTLPATLLGRADEVIE